MSTDESNAQQSADDMAEYQMASDASKLPEFSNLQIKSFEYLSKDTRVNMRMPAELLAAVKAASAEKGIKYQQFVRMAIERALSAEK